MVLSFFWAPPKCNQSSPPCLFSEVRPLNSLYSKVTIFIRCASSSGLGGLVKLVQGLFKHLIMVPAQLNEADLFHLPIQLKSLFRLGTSKWFAEKTRYRLVIDGSSESNAASGQLLTSRGQALRGSWPGRLPRWKMTRTVRCRSHNRACSTWRRVSLQF